MGKHDYTEAEIDKYCYDASISEFTRGLLMVAMEQMHIDEKWLDYLKDETRHPVFRIYFLSAVREEMPEEYLEFFQKADSMEELVAEKAACWKQKIDPEGELENIWRLKHEVAQLVEAKQFLERQLKIYKTYSQMDIVEQLQALHQQEMTAMEERHKLELEKVMVQKAQGNDIAGTKDKHTKEDTPAKKKRLFFGKKAEDSAYSERDQLADSCLKNAEYDVEHLELFKQAYQQGEPVEVLEHLVKAEEKGEDVQVTRKWLERRRKIVEGWGVN